MVDTKNFKEDEQQQVKNMFKKLSKQTIKEHEMKKNSKGSFEYNIENSQDQKQRKEKEEFPGPINNKE